MSDISCNTPCSISETVVLRRTNRQRRLQDPPPNNHPGLALVNRTRRDQPRDGSAHHLPLDQTRFPPNLKSFTLIQHE